jgi:ATP-dependent Lon protease
VSDAIPNSIAPLTIENTIQAYNETLRFEMLHRIELSEIRTDRRKAIAFLRRCKKPRKREALEQKIRDSVTGSIENEAEVYELKDQLKFLMEY